MAVPKEVRSAGAFLFRHAVYVQGVYYIIFGLWPLLHVRSFQFVTGPKLDIWLVKTVALLIIVIGVTLILAAYRQQVDLPVMVLGFGTALALIIIELVYVFGRTISAIYILDTIVEAFFVFAWLRRKIIIDTRRTQEPAP